MTEPPAPLPVRPVEPWAQTWLRRRPVRAVRKVAFNGLGLMPLAETVQARLQRRLDRAGVEFETAEARRLARSTIPGHHRFGAVIATYDRPGTCAEAVASVLAQSVDDCTVIVVNDGGTIPPLPSHDRVSCVTLSQHTGNLGLVRNVGIRLIREYVDMIGFLDDDNTWLPGHLGAHAAVRSGLGPTLSYSAVEVVNTAGKVIDVLDQPWSRARLRHWNFVDANSLVVDASAVSLFSRLHRANLSMRKEDWEYVYRLSAFLTVIPIGEVTVRYLRNPNSYLTDNPSGT